MRFLWAYEAIAIAVIAFAGFNLATSRGGSWVMASPLVLVGAAEAMRVSISGWAVKLPLAGKAIAAVALLGISLASFEGLSLALEQFVNNRVVNVMAAGHAVEAAERDVGRVSEARKRAAGEADKLTGELREIDTQIAELNRAPPPQASASNRTCVGKRGRRISCSSDYLSAAAAGRASDAHVALLKSLSEERAKAQARLTSAQARAADIEDRAADDRLSAARTKLSDEIQLSPMHRLASALFGVSVASETQFQTVKKWIVFGLAGAFATLSMMVSIVAHLQPRPGKVNRMARAWLARRRRPVYRDVPGPVEFRDRGIIKWQGYDIHNGLKAKDQWKNL